MVRNSRKTAPHELEAFHSNDLGEAYAAAEAALTVDDIMRASTFGNDASAHVPVYRGVNDTIAGVDVASERNLNMRIDEMLPNGLRKAVWIGECRSFREVYDKLVAYNVKVAVIDSMPERRLGRALAVELPGRVHLAVFVVPGFNPKDQPEALDFDPKKNLVKLNRTEALDAMMDGIRQVRQAPLQQLPPGYVDQLTAPQRITEYDVQGRSRRVYVTPSGRADDYAMTEVYTLAAAEMWRLRRRIEAENAAANTPVPDAALGVTRGKIAGDEFSDDYKPGFSGR
jgi:hypothetical protein